MWHHPAALAMILASASLLGAEAAAGDTVAVHFSGTFIRQSGLVVSIPFSGSLFYDASTPDASSNPGVNFYEFAPGSAGIHIETATETFLSDPASPDVFAVSLPTYVGVDGQPSPPNDPDAVLGAIFRWGSSQSNSPPELRQLVLERLVVEDLPDGFPLPTSAPLLASALLGSSAWVDAGAGYQLFGRVEAATPIPEPGTALMLSFGLAGLARVGRRKRGAGRLPAAVRQRAVPAAAR